MSEALKTLHLTSYNLVLLRMIKRPEWLYRDRRTLPALLPHSAPVAIDEADELLCRRLIDAYHLAAAATNGKASTSDIWAGLIQSQWTGLLSAIEARDAPTLAQLLATMFRRDFLVGIASGSLVENSVGGLGQFIWRVRCLDDLVSLAESIGSVRTACPEQGDSAFALRDGVVAVAEEIEQRLAISLSFPAIGSAYGFDVGGRLITPETPEHIYAALRASEAMNAHGGRSETGPARIVEIGAGFGGTAMWMRKLNRIPIESYTIIDLPTTNILQGYFLSKVFGCEEVCLFGESGNRTFNVYPAHHYRELIAQPFHMLINENSMPEMPAQAVHEYLTWAKDKLDGVFFSYNQEAYSRVGDFLQTLVPEVVKTVGGFQLLSRHCSWLRRGYVEEVYKTKIRATETSSTQ